MLKNQSKISVVGLGYIGLPTASLLANRGYQVRGIDVVTEIVETINQGKIHIIEPELDTFVQSAVQSGKLKAYTTHDFADVFIIAVPTPIKENQEPNIDYVLKATKSIAPFLQEGNIVILESTSPIGTTEKIVSILQECNIDTSKIYFAYCPERVLPGNTMKELVENDRIIGGITPEAALKVKEFYSTFVTGEILVTNARTAEMSKLTENACRDVSIAFANELSIICDKFGINVWELIKLANHHPRINILQPGSGVGGHCIAVDPWFIVASAPEESKIIRTARQVNNYKPKWVVEKIDAAVQTFINNFGKEPIIACLGLAYKPNIDDLRESPSVEIAEEVVEKYKNVLVVEPNILNHSVLKLTTLQNALEKAEILVLLVSHKEFRNLEIPKNKIIIDVCGVTNK